MTNLFGRDIRKELLQLNNPTVDINNITKKYLEEFIADIKQNKIILDKITACECGNEDLEPLTSVDRYGLDFGTVICPNCGLVITTPQINFKSLAYYYDKYYHSIIYGREKLEDRVALFSKGQGYKIFNIVNNFIPAGKTSLVVAEIGAGTGNVLHEFREAAVQKGLNVDVFGTEFSSDCVEKCKNIGINTMLGDVDVLCGLGLKFDVVILSHVLEHFNDLGVEIAKLKKIIHKDTILYIEVPGILENHKKKIYKFSFNGYHIHVHNWNFTMGSLESVMSRYDFKMLYGNEVVESVFKLSTNKVSKNVYEKIINYIEFLVINYTYFAENAEALESQSLMIHNRDDAIAKKKEEVIKLKNMIHNRDEVILQQNDDKTKLKVLVSNRDDIIETLKLQVSKLKVDIAELKKTINECERQIKSRQIEIEKLNKILENRNVTITQLNDDMTKLKAQISKRNNLRIEISKLNKMIHNRDLAIEKKKEEVGKLKVMIQNRDSAIEKKKEEVGKLKVMVQNRDNALAKIQNEIKSSKNG